MSDYVTSISSASAKRLQRALLIGINEMKEGKSPLDQFDTGALAPLRPVNELAGEKDIVADRVNIDPLMGQCPRSGIKLRLIGLEQEEKETMKNSLLKLVQPTSTRKDGKRNNEKAARAKQAMLFFWDWLE